MVTPPAEQPVAVTEVADQLRLTPDQLADQRSLLRRLLEASVNFAELTLRRSLVTQTLEAVIDRYDSYATAFRCHEIWLPRPPLRSVTEIEVTEEDGTQHTLDASGPTVSERGRLWWPSDDWPDEFSAARRAEGIRIRYTAGYGGRAEVPALIREFIILDAATRYLAATEIAPPGTTVVVRRGLLSQIRRAYGCRERGAATVGVL